MKLSGLKVLVVEDDQDLQELIVEIFQDAGAEVCAASSGRSALTVLAANKFDFVISDMRMPDGDGRFLAKEIQKLSHPKPIFFIYTGYNDISEVEIAELGIEHVFNKPFMPNDIIKYIVEKVNSVSAA